MIAPANCACWLMSGATKSVLLRQQCYLDEKELLIQTFDLKADRLPACLLDDVNDLDHFPVSQGTRAFDEYGFTISWTPRDGA